jgi:hypothetical protein
MGLQFKWRTSNTFHANGTHDVDQVPTTDPMHVIPTLHCRNVPFTTNLTSCTFHIQRDDCMKKALNGLQLLKERGSWDPEDGTLYFELVVTVPRVSAIVLDLSYVLEKETDSDVPLPRAAEMVEPEHGSGPGGMFSANHMTEMASTSMGAAREGMDAMTQIAGVGMRHFSDQAERFREASHVEATTGGLGKQTRRSMLMSLLEL